MQNVNEFIQQLISTSTTYQGKIKLLQQLKTFLLNSSTSIIVNDVDGLFNELKLLMNTSDDAITEIGDFIIALITNNKDPVIDMYISKFYSSLILALSSNSISAVSSIKNCLRQCAIKGIKPAILLSSINKDGISSINPIIRNKSIELFELLVNSCPQLIEDSRCEPHALILLEEILKQGEFAVPLTRIKLNSLSKLLKKLPIELQKTFSDLSSSNKSKEEAKYKEIDDAITNEIDCEFTLKAPLSRKE